MAADYCAALGPLNPDTGEFDVENRGISPDIEVEFDPLPGVRATIRNSRRRRRRAAGSEGSSGSAHQAPEISCLQLAGRAFRRQFAKQSRRAN